MASKEVYVSPSGSGALSGVRLYSGLDWRLLDTSEKQESAVRSTAKDRGASHFALCASSVQEFVKVGKKTIESRRQSAGYFISPTDENPAKKSHSLAAAFALWTADHARAALCAELPTGEFAVVVVINGLPVQDRVLATIEEAVEVVTGYASDANTTVFAQDLVRFPSAVELEDPLSSIVQACSKLTTIRAVPQDLVSVAVVLLVVLVVGGGYYYYTDYKKNLARKALMLKAAQENPIPKYLNALANQKSSLGFERTSFESSFTSAMALPVQVSGWTMKKVGCGRIDMVEVCSASFERISGSYLDIKTALPKLTLSNAATSLDLNTAIMTWTPVLTPAAVEPQMPSLQEFVQGVSGSKLQTWSLAGLALKVQPAVLWPSVAGVPQSFKHPQAVAVGEFSLSGLSLPLVAEAIKTAPANVIWSSWSADVSAPKKGSNPLDDAKVSLNGIYYVKN